MEIKVQNRRQQHYNRRGEYQIEVYCDCNEKPEPELPPIFSAVAYKAHEVCGALLFRGLQTQTSPAKIRAYGFHARAQVYVNIRIMFNENDIQELLKALKEIGVSLR